MPKVKLIVMEIAHAPKTGLSGGDRLFEELVKHGLKFPIEVITTTFGAKHWRQSRLPVTITTLKPNIFDNHAGYSSLFLSYLIRINQATKLLFQRNSESIIHSSTNILPDILPAFLAKKRQHNPWVACVHHLIPPPWKRQGPLLVNSVAYLMQQLVLWCTKSSDLIIVPNHKVLIAKKTAVLAEGVEWQKIFEYQPKKVTGFEAVFLGRLHPAKGIFDALKIWSLVVRQIPKGKLAIIGTGQVKINNSLSKNIKLLGYLPQTNVWDYLKQAKVFLFTDHEAGWGQAVAQAMAAGLPVVGYDVGILGTVFKKGFRMVPLGDTNKFSREVITILQNKTLRNSLSKQALAQAKRFDWSKATKRYFKLLERLSPPS